MQTHAMHLEEKLEAAMEKKLQMERQKLALYVQRMKGVSPLDKLNQGYSYTATEEGKTFSSVKQLRKGELVTIYVKDGHAIAQVQDITARKI